MGKKCFCLLGLLLILTGSFGFAQGPPQVDPRALTILGQAYQALGGAVLLQVQDTVEQVSVSTPEGVTPITTTIKTRGSNQLRWDASVDGRQSSTIISGGRLLQQNRNGQWRTGSSANARNRRLEHLPALLVANELARRDVSLSYIGQEFVEGRTAHRLRVAHVSTLGNDLDAKLTKDSELDVFIDAQTFVILKISYLFLSDTDWRRGLPMEIYYGDYRSVGGLLIPYYQRSVLDGRPYSELRISSFAANVGLSDADFGGR